MYKKIVFWATLVIILIINLYSLKLILNSGYYFDDTLNSQVQAYLDYSGSKLSQFNHKIISEWLQFGRIIPGAMYGYLPWLFLPLIKYKIIIVSFHIIIMLIFSLFLYMLTKSSPFSLLYLLTIPIFFQFRESPDAATSFAILLPLITVKLSISLLFLQKYLNEKKEFFLLVSLLFYLLMLLMFYEIAYLFFPLIIYLVYLKIKSFKKSVKIFLPYVILSLFFIILYFFISLKAPNHYSGSTINFDMRLIIPAFLKQISASLPLSYYLFNPKIGQFPFINKLDYFVSIAYFVLSFIFLFKVKIKKPLPLIIIGLFIVFIPALPISLSLRYQREVAWGIGYLPVYIQYFGNCLFLLGLIVFFINRVKNKVLKIFIISLFSLSLAVSVFINLQINKIVIEHLNSAFKYPRDIIEKALENGLLENVKEGSTILSLNNSFWDADAFYYSLTGKKRSILSTDKYFESENKKNNIIVKKDNNNLYILKYQAINKDLGFAILGKIKEIYYKPSININVANVESTKIFIYKNSVYNYIKFISYPSEYPLRKNNLEEKLVKLHDLKIIKKNDIYELYDLSLENQLIDFTSIKLVNSNNKAELSLTTKNSYTDLPVEGCAVFWEGDFSGPEQYESFSWHWSGKKGLLKIINLDDYGKNILINMSINTGHLEDSNLTVKNGNYVLDSIKVNVNGIQYSKYIYLLPGVNYIYFESDAQKAYTAPTDPRDLRFKITNFIAEEIK